jgi:hypothetical protein
MMMTILKRRGVVVCGLVLAGYLAAATARSFAQQAPAGPTPAERVAALKQNLAQGQKLIRQYEWIETTIISLKGEEKARTQKRCYYGADGKVQKVSLDQPAPAQSSGGRGGRGGRLKEQIVENKKDDMKEYMEQASALIHKYVPPDAEDIQRAKDRVKVDTSTPGRARLTFADYLVPGDSLVVDVDPAANRLTGLSVASYIEKKEDAVTLAVKFGALPDGASYSAETTLEAKAKNIRVVVQNSGHKPVGK